MAPRPRTVTTTPKSIKSQHDNPNRCFSRVGSRVRHFAVYLNEEVRRAPGKFRPSGPALRFPKAPDPPCSMFDSREMPRLDLGFPRIQDDLQAIHIEEDMPGRRPNKATLRRSMPFRFAARVETLERRALLATLLVDTTADTVDPTDNALSLREAIEVSNGTLAVSSLSATEQSLVFGAFLPTVPNDIDFIFNEPSAPASAVINTIALTSPLPAITLPANINGYSQSRSTGNDPTHTDYDDANALVQLDGSAIPSATYSSTDGLAIQAANCTIDGMIISGFTHAGISISGANSQGNFVWGNFIGALPDPTTGRSYGVASNSGDGVLVTSSNNRVGGNNPGLRNIISYNDVGVRIDTTLGTGNLIQNNFILRNVNQGVYVTSSNNVIGEALKGGGNVISGNGAQGVLIKNPVGGTAIQGNYVVGNEIGTDLGNIAGTITRGEVALGNGAEGILIDNSPKNTIGGSVPAARNVLAASVGDGIRITGAFATNNRLLGNYVGFNITPSGLEAFLPNENGITIESASNFIGDTSTGSGNVIDLNRAHGILITGVNLNAGDPAVSNNVVQGNIVGLNPGAGTDFGNTLDGIHIEAASDNTIGGSSAGAKNVISGNNNGLVLFGALATGNIVSGNFIGTALDGLTAVGNAVDGVVIDGAPLNTIGGFASGSGNVISGNNYGVRVTGATAMNNLIQGNFIGTDLSATAVINNQIDGVYITNSASNNFVGGLASGTGNTIMHNAGNGVNINSGTGNAILSNAIDSNNLLGITLGTVGNGNNQQAAPTLISAAPHGTGTSIQGTFASVPNTTYTLQFFSSPTKDPSGFGEGRTFLGNMTITTDATGNATIDQDLPIPVNAGQFITATATDPQNNSSAFSNAVPAVAVQFAFASATYTANETDGSVTISVTRLGGQGGKAAVNFATTSGGTGVAGVDYTDVSGTLFFNQGDPSTKIFTIPILNPQKVGSSVTVNLALSEPANGSTLGAPSTSVLTINGTVPTAVQFQSATASANENGGTIVLTVSRNTNLGTSTVDYSTSNGTAVAGTNYTATSGTLTFLPGDTTKTITIPVLDDGAITNALNFSVNLGNPTGTILGGNAAATVTLNNTDATSILQFSAGQYSSNPGASIGTVVINRSGGTSGLVSVHLATQGGTAIPGNDYQPVSVDLTFQSNEKSKSVTIPLLNTNVSGPDLTVGLSLTSPGGNAILGAAAGATLTIRHAAGGSRPGNPSDTVPPTVTDLTPVLGPGGIVALSVGFSKPMDPSRAANPAGYGFYVTSPGGDGLFGTYDDTSTPISSVDYSSGSNRATIHLASPLVVGAFYQVVFNRDSNPSSSTTLIDTSGNLLAGNGTNAGTSFVSIFAEGPNLTYFDRNGELVNLRVQGPGQIVLYRGADGQAQQLQLVGTSPGHTALNGTVKGHRRGFAHTSINWIAGAFGVKIRLRRAAFMIGRITG